MPTLVTSSRYEVDLLGHVFPTDKYRLIVERLRARSDVEWRMVEPDPAEPFEILSVHDRGYFERARDGALSEPELQQLELPWSDALFDASARCVRGSILAAQLALDTGAGLHVGGGFHHAFADHGEGFCVFNDAACALRVLSRRGRLRRAAVIDCDVHQGNGTAAIFADEADVFTYSIHAMPIYPLYKQPSDLDIGLDAGCGDDEYLETLERTLPRAFEHEPELVVYVAGADPYRHDQLGCLALTQRGLARRDDLVIQTCSDHDVPVMVVLAGGYARRVEDTVAIQAYTLGRAALAAGGSTQGRNASRSHSI